MDTKKEPQINHQIESTSSWYDDFLAAYDYEQPQNGQLLEGTIVRIDKDAMLVDVGLKRDALVPARDLSLIENSVLGKLSVGDQIQVIVLQSDRENQNLLVSLNKGLQFKEWKRAEDYFSKGDILNVKIIGQNRGGLLVKFNLLRGFLPHSQVPELRRVKNPTLVHKFKKELIGTNQKMKIIEIDRQRNRLIFSMQAAHEEQRRKRLLELEIGQIVEGHVVSIVNFGVFINLGDIDGLIHVSQIAWKRIEKPGELINIGDYIKAQIIEIDLERERVSLSRKALLPSPWNEFTQQHQPGDFIEGKIKKILDYGAFIELPNSIEGLIHVSELGYSISQDSHQVVRMGDAVLVKILKIEPLKKRISFSMRQVPLERQIAWVMEHFTEEETNTPS